MQLAQDFYHLLLGHTLDLIIAYTPAGKVAYVSPSVEEILGYEQNDFSRMDPYDLIHMDDQNTVRERYHDPAATGCRVFTQPYRMRKKDGEFAYLETLVQPVFDTDGRVMLLVTSSRDVTDRVGMEQKLESVLHELRFEKSALDAHAIVSVAALDGSITYVNDKFCEITKHRRHELIGSRHNILNSGYHPRSFFNNMLKTISEGRIWQGEIRNRGKDGRFFWVNTTIVPFLDTNGVPYKYVSVRTDITQIKQAKDVLERSYIELERQVNERTKELNQAKERLEIDMLERKRTEELLRQQYSEMQALNQKLQEAQNQLLQSEKMASVGQLAAGVAHEINNPIGYVSSNLGMLKTYFDKLLWLVESYEKSEFAINDSEALRALHQIKEEIELPFLRNDLMDIIRESKDGVVRVKNIVQNLKDFSRLDSGDEWVQANLHPGIDSTLNIVANEIKYKAQVIKEYGDLPEIECLPSQLNQVFLNLIVNASHAIDDKGVITIRTGVEGDEVSVEVMDTGKGIVPENLPRIFDPFFTTKPVGKGTGLGLSLAYSIVQKHHGRVEVDSEVGKGTTFRICLPVKQPTSIA